MQRLVSKPTAFINTTLIEHPNLATLRTTVQNLQSQPTALSDPADVAVVRQELQALNEKCTQLEANRAEWEKLGRVGVPYACTEIARLF
jgi:hypothetical protein